ncbi:MAG: polysaccharide deacetylase family protein [Planctomycetota bacterium]|nr:polysaccharide deacetylase family protein [Planctomycetota bacterium]
MKHKLKGWARELWSRGLYHTGLWRLVDRLMPPRLLVLAGHCVEEEASNGGLPADMKLSRGRLEYILRTLGRRFPLVSVGAGQRAIAAGAERSMVALSMDDGYADNRSALLPLLERVDGKATVYLESRPLEERRVNWSHKWFWLIDKLDAEQATRLMMVEVTDADTSERLRRLLEEAPGDLAYRSKRVLKYEAPAGARDEALDRIFQEQGGDERALCERIYMDWEDVRALHSSGRFELGGHTVHHHVLSTLTAEEQAEEVRGGREVLVRELGEDAGVSFAYPFGRRWDFDAASADAVQAAGFVGAVTTHAGVVTKGSDPLRLPRWMIDEDTPIHHLVTEACGGFALLRRLGIDLVE